MKKILILLLVMLFSLAGCANRETDKNITQSKENIQTNSSTHSGSISQQNADIQSDWVVIALLDTGVSSTAITSDHLLSGYNYVTNSYDTQDLINHGTAVTSLILGCESAGVNGAAENAYIVPLVVVTKQNGENVSVSAEILAKAIRDSIDIYKADIINVSLGIQKDVPKLVEAVAYAEEKGVLVVSAVGNGGASGKTYYPAAYDTVLAVGSCDENGQKSDFSQSGSDILAKGEDIWLASRNGKTYGARGTSYATGFVSAEAAKLFINEPTLLPKELRDKIIQKAADLGGYLH